MLRKAEIRLPWIVAAFLTIVLLSSVSLIQVYSQIRKATQLTLSPETFTVTSGQNITLTAKLASYGQPLAGKQIVFAASLGFVNPNVAVTDEGGFALTVYTAPVVSVRSNVTVTASFLGDLEYEGSIALSKGIIEVGLPTVSISGASFAVPETLKNDVSSYRNTIPKDVLKLLPVALPNESFILATHQEDVFLVFANESDKGLAYVDGWKLPQNISLAGMSVGVIVAKSVTFEKEGTPTTISEILANPDNYRFKLVRISADRRQASILYDHDVQPHIWLPVTVGYLVEKPSKQLDVLRALLNRASDFAFKLDEQFIRSFLQTEEEERLWLFNFEHEYWYDVPAITNGIVIPRDYPIFKLINQSMPVIGRLAGLDGKVVLYDVKTDIPYEEVSSVSGLKANSSKYVNKTVKIVANCYGGYISVQEVLRKYADKDIPVDVRLEGLAAWNEVSVPPKREELLLSAGASSFHQDQPFVNVTGVFELIGKVVSTREISDSLPEDVALLICQAKKVGEIDIEKLAQQVKDKVKDDVGELYWVLQDIYPYKAQPNIPYKVPTKVFSPKAPIFVENPREVPEICVEKNFTINIAVAAPEAPIKLNITNSMVSNISITLKETARNVTIFFEKLVEKPPDVPEPPGLVYAYHEISINIPEGAIKEANITFWVLKEWLATHKVAVESVVMLRYHAGEWANLQTRVIGENATHYKFIAETPGFSTFAIIPEFPSALIFILMLTTTLTMALWKTKRKRLTS
jgi:PGF-pre-PGF domain-containing protein